VISNMIVLPRSRFRPSRPCQMDCVLLRIRFIQKYYALHFVRPIASLKSYHVTIQQLPVSDPPTEWKLYIGSWLTPSYDESCPHLTRPI
jgi:hypothetical protein